MQQQTLQEEVASFSLYHSLHHQIAIVHELEALLSEMEVGAVEELQTWSFRRS